MIELLNLIIGLVLGIIIGYLVPKEGDKDVHISKKDR